MKTTMLWPAALLLVGTAAALETRTACAQEPSTFTVVATGLNAPRGLRFLHDRAQKEPFGLSECGPNGPQITFEPDPYDAVCLDANALLWAQAQLKHAPPPA